jgi:hypothetical protein
MNNIPHNIIKVTALIMLPRAIPDYVYMIAKLIPTVTAITR